MKKQQISRQLNKLSFPKVVIGNLQRLSFSQAYGNSGCVADPRLQASGNNTPSPVLRASSPAMGEEEERSGFTLIELLVVVLIIGILAAVALPQYQKAVDKSRAVQAIVMLKAIVDAQEVYYLEHGEYTNQLENLDIQVPDAFQGQVWNIPQGEDPSQYLFLCHDKRSCSAWATNPNLPAFEFHMKHSPVERYKPIEGGKWCKLTQDDRSEQAKKLCESLGELDPKMVGVVNSPTKYYVITNY